MIPYLKNKGQGGIIEKVSTSCPPHAQYPTTVVNNTAIKTAHII